MQGPCRAACCQRATRTRATPPGWDRRVVRARCSTARWVIRAQTEQGKRFERVRLVDEPVTQGQEFLLASGLGNVAAGEDIRNLTRSEAQALRLADYDFWLFDSKTLVRFAFDEDDVTLGVYVTEDPADVLTACQARDAAWHYATPTSDFQQRVRSSV
ncbi:DUF6879 family protein [Actinomycetota bacterium Odt1-20B]